VSDQGKPVDRHKTLQLSYERLCASYEGITDFRGKLLTLLLWQRAPVHSYCLNAATRIPSSLGRSDSSEWL
jgi:hypothetical protein